MTKLKLIKCIREDKWYLLDRIIKNRDNISFCKEHLIVVIELNRIELLKLIVSKYRSYIEIDVNFTRDIFKYIIEHIGYSTLEILLSSTKVRGDFYYLIDLLRLENNSVYIEGYKRIIEIAHKYAKISFSPFDCSWIIINQKMDILHFIHNSIEINKKSNYLSIVYETISYIDNFYLRAYYPRDIDKIIHDVTINLKFNFEFIRILHEAMKACSAKGLIDMHLAYTIRGFVYGF